MSECRVPVAEGFVGQEAYAPCSGKYRHQISTFLTLYPEYAAWRIRIAAHRPAVKDERIAKAKGKENRKRRQKTLHVALAELAAPHGFVDRVQQTRHSERLARVVGGRSRQRTAWP